MGASGWFESAVQDIRYAVRSLRGAPTFTPFALITLALGIAATTAIFSTVNATLLRPLPYLRSADLVAVGTRLVDGRVTTGLVSSAEITMLAGLSSHVDRVTGYFSRPFDSSLIRDDGTPVSVVLSGVSEGFVEVLGLPMTRGRPSTREEHIPAGRDAPFFLVISDESAGSTCSAGSAGSEGSVSRGAAALRDVRSTTNCRTIERWS